MISPATTVSTLWGVWLLGWLLSAVSTRKTVAEQSSSARIGHSLFVWVGAGLLFFHPRSLPALMQPLIRETWISWVGVALAATGLGFAGWARIHLGRLWSGRVTLKEDHTIVRTGPYGLVRHPIYTGLLLALVGTVLAQVTVAAIAGLALLAIGFLIKMRQEERLLTGHFGAAYEAYRGDVATLIPYVW